jgi:hypothetical protein
MANWIWMTTWTIGKVDRQALLKAIDEMAAIPGAYQEQGLLRNDFVYDEEHGEAGHIMLWAVKPERHMFNQAALKRSNEIWGAFLRSQGLKEGPPRIFSFEIIEPNVK